MAERPVGVIGASSLVARYLLPQLAAAGWTPVPWTRGQPADPGRAPRIAHWISLAPVWTVPAHFELWSACGATRVVALSSSSVEGKAASRDPQEQAVVARLKVGEAALQAWGGRTGVQWVLLRPTLIYGGGHDRNVSDIARLIRRFGWFPLAGAARGLRQPVHAADVAAACVAALAAAQAAGQVYALSGGETLSYRHMVARVFQALGRRPRLFTLPGWAVVAALQLLRLLPRFRHWTPAMVTRMNADLVFDHGPAARDLGFSPRPFHLAAEDLP